MSEFGYACISLDSDGKTPEALHYRSMTYKQVMQYPYKDRHKVLNSLWSNNATVLINNALLARSNRLNYRIPSSVFPLATHPEFRKQFDAGWDYELEAKVRKLRSIRELVSFSTQSIPLGSALNAAIRRVDHSTHPDQFVVPLSNRQDVVDASLYELDMHWRLASAIGPNIGSRFVVNIHCGPRVKHNGIPVYGNAAVEIAAERLIKILSSDMRKTITLENDEFSWSAADTLALCKATGMRMVYDLHHDIVNSFHRRVAFSPLPPSVIRETWPSFSSPKLHVSCPVNTYPGETRASDGASHRRTRKSDTITTAIAMRRHADYIWSPYMRDLVRPYMENGFNVMVEAKAKNLAAVHLREAMRK